jgi:putative ABC transport system permease protein
LILELTYLDLIFAAGLIVIAISLSYWRNISLEKDLLIGAGRTLVQLIAVGYVLAIVFSTERWYIVLFILCIMIAIAIHTIIRRQTYSFRHMSAVISSSLIIGTGVTLSIVIGIIIRVDPWYKPQYIIPIMGMILGNSMNGVALATERMSAEINEKRAIIEARLALGATSRQAVTEVISSAIRAAMIPTINSLMTVGIVSLPGMMTGQVLSGTSPLIAVKYQIVVMYMITAAVMISSLLIVLQGYKKFFTRNHQFCEI